jgi:uncharacterized OsmC-like protein
MDRDQLRAAQAPLKEQYRSDPSSALTPLEARGGFDEPDVTCTVQGWAGPVRAGLHRATGGAGQDACSGDMLLEALVACAGVTLRSVSLAMGLTVSDARLTASAVFDARGTLGVDRAAPVGISQVVVRAVLDTEADDGQLERLGAATERYCVVGQSLADGVRIEVSRWDR